MSRFIPVDRQTDYLLPPSVDEWLPDGHLARFVVDVVEQLDLSTLTRRYMGRGSKAHHPAVLLSLLVYGYGHHDRLLTAVGGLLIPVFLFHWYYDMDLTLTEKSVVLIGSGLAMVAGRFLFCRGGAGEEADA